jgi:hypothetical protein
MAHARDAVHAPFRRETRQNSADQRGEIAEFRMRDAATDCAL